MDVPKTDVGGLESGDPQGCRKGLPEVRQGLPDENRRGNQCRLLFWRPSGAFKSI
jgi:hypothetical protein